MDCGTLLVKVMDTSVVLLSRLPLRRTITRCVSITDTGITSVLDPLTTRVISTIIMHELRKDLE